MKGAVQFSRRLRITEGHDEYNGRVKTLTVLMVLVAAPLVLFAAISAGQGRVAAPKPDEAEFFFARLVYRQNGKFGRSSTTMAKPSQPYLCPEFGGGDFFPPQGWGWATDTPGSDCKLMGAVHRLTGQRVYPHPNYIEIMDKDLFRFPYAYVVEAGQMQLSSDEAAQLREYLLRGGFLHFDDFWGTAQRGSLFAELAKVFPDREPKRLDLKHEIFGTFFDVDQVVQVPRQRDACAGGRTAQVADDTEPAVYGISDDSGRLMVVITYNADVAEGWEFMDLPCFPNKYSHYSLRLAINFIIYAMSH